MGFRFNKGEKKPSRFKKNLSKKSTRRVNINKQKICCILRNSFGVILLLAIILTSFYFGYLGFNNERSKHIAVDAVNDMFTFENYETLHDNNMTSLRSITTQKVYNEVTFTNLQTALNSYLPFFGHATRAQILAVSDTCVTFRVINPSVKLNTLYTMYYKVNFWGQIDFLKVYKCTPMFNE